MRMRTAGTRWCSPPGHGGPQVRSVLWGLGGLGVLRVVGVLGVLGVVGVLAGGCTSDPPRSARASSSSRPAPVPSASLDASVTQLRFDEGTSKLRAGVTNKSHRDISVTRATIAWEALTFPSVRLPGDAVHPGETAAFEIAYGSPRCDGSSRSRPVLAAVIDGHQRRLRLRVEDPGLLVRLQAKACARQGLDRVVSVRLHLGRRTERLAGEEYLPADLVLRRRPGSETQVRVVDLDGSVLIDLLPRGGRAALPAVLGPGQGHLDLRLLFGSAHRCDGHSRGQSSQTFLFSAYLRPDGRPTQRVVLPLSPAEQDRLIRVVDRDCDEPQHSGDGTR